MKKYLLIASIALLLVTSPVLAAPGNSNNRGKSEEAKANHGPSQDVLSAQNDNGKDKKNEKEEEEISSEVLSQETEVEETENQENEELEVENEEEENGDELPCDPEAEWKNHGHFVSCVAKLKLGGKVTSVAAKSDVGKKNFDPSPTATPTATPTPGDDPITSPVESIDETSSPLESIGSLLNRFLEILTNLL